MICLPYIVAVLLFFLILTAGDVHLLRRLIVAILLPRLWEVAPSSAGASVEVVVFFFHRLLLDKRMQNASRVSKP